jgi:hypothetical protein
VERAVGPLSLVAPRPAEDRIALEEAVVGQDGARAGQPEQRACEKEMRE